MEDGVVMQFPMVALGKVEVAGAKYPQGAVFDALDAGSYRFLEKERAARPATDTEKRTGVADPVPTDQPAAAAASEGEQNGNTVQTDPPVAGAKAPRSR